MGSRAHPDQFVLGPCDQSRANDTIFFAVLPDKPAADRAYILGERIDHQEQLHGDRTSPDRLHVTMRWVGRYDAQLARQAQRAGAMVAARRFIVRFDHVMSFHSNKENFPLVLCCEDDSLADMRDFNRTLREAIASCDLDAAGAASYTPHMTLLYSRKSIPAAPVSPVSWTVGSLVLIYSLVGQDVMSGSGNGRCADGSDERMIPRRRGGIRAMIRPCFQKTLHPERWGAFFV